MEHFRKQTDGSFTKLEPTFHNMVMFKSTAERAYDRFRVGDSFVASGYINEYKLDRNGQVEAREEFVARRIGHDTVRTRYYVERPKPEQSVEQSPGLAGVDGHHPAVGM